ncbi:VanW family protein [Candidatus Parcubacteria bacterium]|nr:VanW family protein [Candidatus Parcubacteria bacterium]
MKKFHSFKALFKWLLFFLAIFLIIITTLLGTYLSFDYKYKNKIFPGIYVGNIHLGGLTTTEAINHLNKKINFLNENGIIVNCQKKETTLYPIISSTESDLAYQIITFNVEETINSAYDIARSDGLYENTRNKMRLVANPIKIKVNYTLNQTEIDSFFSESFSDIEQLAKDATLTYDKISGKFEVEKEKEGKKIDLKEGLKLLKNNLDNLDNSPIKISIITDIPRILKKDAINIEEFAGDLSSNAPIVLKFNKRKWNIKKSKLSDWFELKINKNKIAIGLNDELIQEYLKENISPDIDIKPSNAKFEIKDGKVIEFQTSEDGRELNIQSSFEKIEFEFIEEKNNEIELAIKELKSELQTEEVNDLGIKELLGTGESNFSGSPKNRRHNIKIGATSVNGTLIKPGDEFSLVKILGKINKESGYLPELVIKGNRTIAEYGGGLCQVGTTMFRGTVDSGLPVTARRPHSYRVSYYEPAGTDATIYNPWPDYKFKNDTEHHILLQSRIEGDYLYFDFWGTNDGRIATHTEPTIYNITRPGVTKIIETLDLSPGVKRCTESAHSGADAYFDYTVTYPNEEVKEERFKSHYVPWTAVCLLGVEELTSEKEKNATTSEETIAE